jgi:hypothetical protein
VLRVQRPGDADRHIRGPDPMDRRHRSKVDRIALDRLLDRY